MEEKIFIEEKGSVPLKVFNNLVTAKLNGDPYARLTFGQMFFPKPGEESMDNGLSRWLIPDDKTRELVDQECARLHNKYPTMQPPRVARKAAEKFKLKRIA